MTYLPRIADGLLAERLASIGAVSIEGPKGCGKTETARQLAASEVRLDVDAAARDAAAIDPALVLDGERPRLLDEWQAFPALWEHVRRAVDDAQAPGQFILAGSATPNDDVRRHSGAGRIASLTMRPMTLFEVGRSSGEVSLAALFDGTPPSATGSVLDLPATIEALVAGGWPQQQPSPTARFVLDYLRQTIEVDVPDLVDGRRDPIKLAAVVSSLGRNVATSAGDATIAQDADVARPSVASYLSALRRLMIVEDQPAFNVHLRSAAALRSRPRRHLVDPSLAVAAVGGSGDTLMRDLRFTGLLFESLVVRDLRVLSQPIDGTVTYLQTDTMELDAVVGLRDGRWGAVEVKLGGNEAVEAGAASLRRVANAVDTERSTAPAFLAVVTATGGYAYRRPDGVDVIPLGALAP